MKVIIHHAQKITQATELAIAHERLHHRTNQPPYRPEPLNFEVIKIDCFDKHDYGDSLKARWEKGEGFINLEQDVAPWPGALTQMWECREEQLAHGWCALPLIVHGCENQTNFGCVRFSSEFLKFTAGIWDSYPRNDVFDWRSLDGWFYQTMKETYGMFHHTHRPAALHANWTHL